MTAVKVTQIGSSVGIVLPKGVLERLRVSKGDMLHIVETPDGIELTGYDPEFETQMKAAEKVMRNRRSALKKLAE